MCEQCINENEMDPVQKLQFEAYKEFLGSFDKDGEPTRLTIRLAYRNKYLLIPEAKKYIRGMRRALFITTFLTIFMMLVSWKAGLVLLIPLLYIGSALVDGIWEYLKKIRLGMDYNAVRLVLASENDKLAALSLSVIQHGLAVPENLLPAAGSPGRHRYEEESRAFIAQSFNGSAFTGMKVLN